MNFNIIKYPILSSIDSTQKLRLLSQDNLLKLCNELRCYLLDSISDSSGHLASGLGVVELTIALHYAYNTPFDHLIWDVGHQSYPHKILTGRRDMIHSLRKKGGLHPFPCREESEYDILSVGHSSTSISAGLGISVADSKNSLKCRTVCVIGDGAMTAGMAFEALNHAGYIKSDILVILNDNEMSISKNIGALTNHLLQLRNNRICFTSHNNSKYKFFKLLTFKSFIKYIKNCIQKTNTLSDGVLFKELGFNYTGPVDGHNLIDLIHILKSVRKLKGPQLLHIITKKGYGYKPAEKDPINFHSVPKFNYIKGNLPKQNKNLTSYSKIFGDWLCEIAAKDKKLVAITPAMCEGSGMLEFSRKYPDQYFDVAIAEQHAVTFAAGLAIREYKPIVAIYSTFLQRAYDQVIHDVAIPKLPVLFAIDRAGIVGPDGQTHQGAFDLSYLRCIPGMIIMTPSDENECRHMLYTGYHYKDGPVAVRYPRGDTLGVKLTLLTIIPIGKGVIKRRGKKIAILNFGTLLPEAIKVAHILNATVVDMRFAKPIDEDLLLEIARTHTSLVTLEENAILGGAGSGVNEILMAKRKTVPVLNLGLPDKFISHGSQDATRIELGFEAKKLEAKIRRWMI